MFGRKKKDILANGIQARATITNVQDTGMTINDNPRVKLTLQVQPDGDMPFEATKKVTVSRITIPRVGDTMWVRYDPADHNAVEFDEAKTAQVNAAARTSMTVNTGMTLDAGSTVIDARNVPGLRDELLKAVADAIKKLNDLRVAGALTDAEFEAQKAKILSES